jgi:hypothetical protein
MKRVSVPERFIDRQVESLKLQAIRYDRADATGWTATPGRIPDRRVKGRNP